MYTEPMDMIGKINLCTFCNQYSNWFCTYSIYKIAGLCYFKIVFPLYFVMKTRGYSEDNFRQKRDIYIKIVWAAPPLVI